MAAKLFLFVLLLSISLSIVAAAKKPPPTKICDQTGSMLKGCGLCETEPGDSNEDKMAALKTCILACQTLKKAKSGSCFPGDLCDCYKPQ
ncbi:hypothetical protein HDE_04917 [Halotydeus destructor]|nr:hypothetical protein HDE_04917 [Halotydeus destructor]